MKGRLLPVSLAIAGAIAIGLITINGGEPATAAAVTVVVTDAGDGVHACAANGGGTCSLRDAILFANSNPGHDTITFNIPGLGVHVIRPLAALPALSDIDGVTIDGYTQTASSPNASAAGTGALLTVEVDGSTAGNSNGLTIAAGTNRVRGLIINRWAGSGVFISGGQGNVIAGNFIGTTASGNAAGNLRGVTVTAGVSATVIGGQALAAKNIISGNTAAGILLQGGGVSSTVIVNNLIGTGVSGLSDAGNAGWGIELIDGPSDSTIGGTGGGANTIAFNLGGVRLAGVSRRNMILGNQMFLNTNRGIDLGVGGVNPNDQGDSDDGPNSLQNFPVLAAAVVSPTTGKVVVTGTQDSNILGGQNRVDVYIADITGDGHGAGRAWLLSEAGLPSGKFDFATAATTPATAVAVGARITATATSNDGTSEFSSNITAVINQKPIANAGVNQVAIPKQIVTLNGSGSNDPDARPQALQYTWEQKTGKPVTLSDDGAAQPTFVPSQGGSYKFDLTVSDGLDSSVVSSVTVSINDLNPPTARPQSVSAVGGNPRTIRLTAADIEATSFVFKIIAAPSHGVMTSFNENTGVGIYTAEASFVGTDTFTFTASDGINTSSPATVTITVIGGVSIETGILPSAIAGRPYNVQLSASGGSGNYAWSFTGGAVPPGLVLGADGSVKGVPITAGKYEFGVEVDDGNGLHAIRQIQVTIIPASAYPYRLFAFLISVD